MLSKLSSFGSAGVGFTSRSTSTSTSSSGSFDVIVLGGGPGGYVASLRAAKHGLKVACIDPRSTLGGTCLNVGCIPSKCLLHSSHVYESLRLGEPSHVGVNVSKDTVQFDLPKIMNHKEKVVSNLTSSISALFKKNKIEKITATGKLTSNPGEVQLSNGNTIHGKNIILATGSEPIPLPFAQFDERIILSSTGALSLKRVPEKLVVIGAGIIGLELGSVWRRLGSQVTFIEFLDKIAPGTDMAVSKHMKRVLERQGLAFHLSTKVTSISKSKESTTVFAEGPEKKQLKFDADAVLVCVGRKPSTSNLGLDSAGIKTERGKIIVDDHCRTNVQNVFAIGDIVRGPSLAHKASEEGFAVAEGISSGKAAHKMKFEAVPGVLYTSPEVAWVGMSQEDCVKAKKKISIGQFNIRGNGRARSMNETEGFAKLIADGVTGRILGIHIIGPDAGEMISGATFAIEHGLTAKQIAATTIAHPTVSEIIKEAALIACNMPVHQ